MTQQCYTLHHHTSNPQVEIPPICPNAPSHLAELALWTSFMCTVLQMQINETIVAVMIRCSDIFTYAATNIEMNYFLLIFLNSDCSMLTLCLTCLHRHSANIKSWNTHVSMRLTWSQSTFIPTHTHQHTCFNNPDTHTQRLKHSVSLILFLISPWCWSEPQWMWEVTYTSLWIRRRRVEIWVHTSPKHFYFFFNSHIAIHLSLSWNESQPRFDKSILLNKMRCMLELCFTNCYVNVIWFVDGLGVGLRLVQWLGLLPQSKKVLGLNLLAESMLSLIITLNCQAEWMQVCLS